MLVPILSYQFLMLCEIKRTGFLEYKDSNLNFYFSNDYVAGGCDIHEDKIIVLSFRFIDLKM